MVFNITKESVEERYDCCLTLDLDWARTDTASYKSPQRLIDPSSIPQVYWNRPLPISRQACKAFFPCLRWVIPQYPIQPALFYITPEYLLHWCRGYPCHFVPTQDVPHM